MLEACLNAQRKRCHRGDLLLERIFLSAAQCQTKLFDQIFGQFLDISYESFGSEDVGKAFLYLRVADIGKIVFGLLNFQKSQKTVALLYALPNCDKRLVPGVEIRPPFNLKAIVFLLVFIGQTSDMTSVSFLSILGP